LPIAPEWSGNLGFDYGTDLSDSMTLGFTGNARYTDDFLANEQGDQRPAATTDSFWIVDVGVRLVFNQRLRLALIGRNLADEMWNTRVSDKPGAPGQLHDTPKQGRQYVLEVQYDF
jgi:outer membrane receptor protein involved in Fe transport